MGSIDNTIRLVLSTPKILEKAKNNPNLVVVGSPNDRLYIPTNWLSALHNGLVTTEDSNHCQTAAQTNAFEAQLSRTNFRRIGFSGNDFESDNEFKKLFDDYLIRVGEMFRLKDDWKNGRRKLLKESPNKWRFWIGPASLNSRLPAKDIAITPQEVMAESGIEGAPCQITTNRYERCKKLRNDCINHFLEIDDGRLACQACDVDFGEHYGELGAGFIHIHHKNPLGNRQEEHLVDPTTDLEPVCPNCHAMIHRDKHIRTSEQIKAILSSAQS